MEAFMLAELRSKIDSIDQYLIQLLNARFEVVQEIGQVKVSHQMPVLDSEREGILLNKLYEKIGTSPHAPAIKNLYETIMASSRELQSSLSASEMSKKIIRVAAIGENGSNSFSALNVLKNHMPFSVLQNTDVAGVTVEDFEEAASLLKHHALEYALLPIENAITGSIPQVYEILRDEDFEIVAEVILPIEHVLATHRGTKLESIQRVYSHPQALDQCAVFLSEMGVDTTPVASTMHGIPLLKHAPEVSAVITTREGASEFGLEIAASQISKYKENYTRFVLLRSKWSSLQEDCFSSEFNRDGQKKCAIAMTLKHEKGTLAQALFKIAQLGYNLVKIESRPIPESPFEYQFYIEIGGGTELHSENINEVKVALIPAVTSCRVLGIYPIFIKKNVDNITN